MSSEVLEHNVYIIWINQCIKNVRHKYTFVLYCLAENVSIWIDLFRYNISDRNPYFAPVLPNSNFSYYNIGKKNYAVS